jgi:hypothetical protein
MTQEEFFVLLFLVTNFIIYLFRGVFPFDKIWFVLRSFWVALFLVLIYNNLKDRTKKS